MAIRWTAAFFDFPPEAFESGVEFWLRITDATLSPFGGPEGEFAMMIPTSGDPCLGVQRLQSGAVGNHLDLYVDDIRAEAERASALGATVKSEKDDIVVLLSPGGLPFCMLDHHGQSQVPGPVEWPGGQRSIADQICVDVPAARFDREHDFWSTLTGRPLLPTKRSEFRRLQRPEGAPLEILVQSVDEGDPDASTRAHIDLACSDMDAETVRHVESGAVRLDRFEHWQVMRDPTGLVYCITDRKPR
ncbi:VOC family protein [Glycomyces tarimensis]